MVTGWPSGSQRAASNPAEQLLTQAVAYWDASQYRDGDRFLRNRGVAGELLDLRLGSSVVPNSNDPRFLAPEDTGYVYLPGVGGNFLSVPDEAALDITGDIDIRARIALDSWITTDTIVAKSQTANETYRFVANNNRLRLVFSVDGTTIVTVDSTETLGFPARTTKWVRITREQVAGEVKFFTSDNGLTWTQLGTTITGVTTSNWYVSTSPVEIGARNAGGANPLSGNVYQVVIYSDLTETNKVLDVDCDAITSGSQTSFTAITGQTVTINRSTSGRKSVAVPSNKVKKLNDPNLFFPGIAGNHIQTTDNRQGAASTWQVSVLVNYIRSNRSNPIDRSTSSKLMLLGLNGTNNTGSGPRLWWPDGGNVDRSAQSTPLFPPGFHWYRATIDASAADTVVTFEYAAPQTTEPTSWTTLYSETLVGVTGLTIPNVNARIGQLAYTNIAGLHGNLYRLIERIDGTVVLDVDASKAPTDFTAGAQTYTFLAETGQTLTLNSTANSGMAVVPERFGRGGAVFLFGTDDYMEVVDNWQHQLLNFGQADSFTVLLVMRRFAAAATEFFFAKRTGNNAAASQPGYFLYGTSTSTNMRFRIDDGSVLNNSEGAITTEATAVVIGTVTASGLNVTGASSPTARTTGSLANTAALRVGAASGTTTNAGNLEVTAAAIFRRALSPAEIKTISDYFTARIA